MRVLNGDKMPEQLMIWLKDLGDKILKNAVLTEPEKLAILRRLVDMEAQTILSNVENDYKNNYSQPEDVNLLIDYRINEEVLAKCTTDNQVRIYFGDGGVAAVKKFRIEHIICEAVH